MGAMLEYAIGFGMQGAERLGCERERFNRATICGGRRRRHKADGERTQAGAGPEDRVSEPKGKACGMRQGMSGWTSRVLQARTQRHVVDIGRRRVHTLQHYQTSPKILSAFVIPVRPNLNVQVR